MTEFIARRLALGVLIVLTVSFVAFLMVGVTGDLAASLAGEDATDEDIEALRRSLGLDQPILVRYAEWAGNAFRGDFGQSYFFPIPAVDLILSKLPVTLILASVSLVLALLIAIPAGMVAAMHEGGIVDRIVRSLAGVAQSMPSFFLGLMLIIVLGVQFRILPISGNDSAQHFVMPIAVLTIASLPPFLRLTRSTMLEVMRADYMRTAHAKGLPPWRVMTKHGLRNAILPIVSLAAVQFGNLLEGSIIVEAVFALDGIGMLAWQSVQRLDFIVIQALVFWASMVYVVLTTLADVLNAFLNPRLRDARAGT